MTTKWENEIPINYKLLFENYKNIEMFQNIHDTTDSIVEGFNFAGDDFNIHASRKKIFRSTAVGKNIKDLINSMIDFILCPFYKSDMIIDNTIKNMLGIFLAVDCKKIPLNGLTLDVLTKSDFLEKNEDEDSKIYDLSDLIDSELLYHSKENFENIKEGLTSDNIETVMKKNKECDIKIKESQKEIKKYSKTIRDEIYNIIFLPIIFNMFYNCYYMLIHRNPDGSKPEFIDFETTFYKPNIKPYLGYFFDIAIKPLTWFYNILVFIANPANEKNGFAFFKTYVSLTEKYPYVFYILLFIVMFSIISTSQRDIISTWGKLLFKPSGINLFSGFAIGVMIIEFFRVFINEFADWRENLTKQIFSGPIKFVVYWILRIIVNIMLYPFAGSLCTYYLFIYLFFGVSVSNEKDQFEVFNEMDDAIYEKMYKRFNNSCNQLDWWGFVVKYFFRFVFLFFIEIVIFILLLRSIDVYSQKIPNANILSFLLILISSCMFVLGMLCFMKYLTKIPYLDAKYDIMNSS